MFTPKEVYDETVTVKFFNYSKNDITVTYNESSKKDCEYLIKAGDFLYLPENIAVLFAEKLAERELEKIASTKPAILSKKNVAFIKEMQKSILYENNEEKTSSKNIDTIKADILRLNKNIKEGKKVGRPKKTKEEDEFEI